MQRKSGNSQVARQPRTQKPAEKTINIYGGSMSDPSSELTNEVERARTRLEVLQELELLESEFRLIENEYNQRKQHLTAKLNCQA